MAGPEEALERPESVPAPAVEETVGGECPPQGRAHGLPDAGVVTPEPQPDEEHAFGSAAELVAEWRRLRTGGTSIGSGVEQARAEERRWELEILLIEEHGLTLPPDREPLQGSKRDDHLRWRREALAHARRATSDRRTVGDGAQGTHAGAVAGVGSGQLSEHPRLAHRLQLHNREEAGSWASGFTLEGSRPGQP